MNYIILFLLTLFPSLASAADLFKPSADDVSMKMLNQLFGGLMQNMTGGQDVFGLAMGVFNGSILTIGGILATYTIISGTIGTAHDGELLGKKFSSVWLPIRYGIGTALILPILPGGYCTIQGLVMWVFVQGVGLADMAWSAYSKSTNSGVSVTFDGTAQMKIQKVAEDAFLAAVCVEAQKRYIKEATTGVPDALNLKGRFDWKMVGDGSKYVYGDQKGLFSVFSKNKCGWVKLPDPIEKNTVLSGAASTGSNILGSFNNLFQPIDVSPLVAGHVQQTTKLVMEMNQLAAEAVNNDEIAGSADAYYQRITKASKDYLNGILVNANTVAAKNANSKNGDGKDFGWILAGANFMSLINTSNNIKNFMQRFPTSSANIDMRADPATQEAVKYMIGNQVLSGRGTQWSLASGSEAASQAAEDHKDSETSGGGKIALAIGEVMTKINIYELQNDTRHPIIVLYELGSRLTSAWATLLVVLPAISLATGWIPGVGAAVQGAISIVMTCISLPLAALLGVAFMCAWVLPFMPFLIWTAAVFGVLVQVSIAVIAAPLWCCMHLHPNGDDLTGKGGNGYTLLMGLILRPTLLIFGFIVALALSTLGGYYINGTFFQVFSNSQGESAGAMGFVDFIFGLAIYAGFMYALIKKCFGLIHIIPDELLKWFGGSGDSVGSYVSTMSDGARGGITAINAAVSAGTQNQAAKGLGGVFGNGKPGAPKDKGNGGGDLEGKGGDASDNPLSSKDQAEKDTSDTKDAVHEKINSQSGVLSEGAVENTKSGLDNAMKRSGPDKDNMMKDLKQRMEDKPDAPVLDHINGAYSQSLSKTHGYKTGELTYKSTGGFHSEKANDLVDKYKDKFRELSTAAGGANGANEQISRMNRDIIKNFRNDPKSTENKGNIKLSHYINEGFEKLDRGAFDPK